MVLSSCSPLIVLVSSTGRLGVVLFLRAQVDLHARVGAPKHLRFGALEIKRQLLGMIRVLSLPYKCYVYLTNAMSTWRVIILPDEC